MNSAVAWLLDLDRLSLSDESVRFAFERDIQSWAWAGAIIVLVGFAALTYRRLIGPAWARAVLAGLRAALLLLLFTLVLGPELVKSEETVEKDWVIALVDRSASMTIADAAIDGDMRPREEQLRDALELSSPAWAQLARDRVVVWLGFDAGAYDLPADADTAEPDLNDPVGRRTSLAAALDQALRRAAARPLSGVVLFSDGRSIDEPSRAAIRQLQSERAPVHVFPLGSEESFGDLAIRRAEGPGVAFVDDAAPVRVEIERLGAAPAGGTLRLIDVRTGLTLDEQTIDPLDPQPVVTLTHTPEKGDEGEATWAVVLDPDGPDLVPGNNRAEISMRLVDRPLRALFIDGRPRWEQRYLKNLLLREASVTSSNLILAPDRRYIQEGDEEIVTLPDSVEEWAPFDVVILGDVQPQVFTEKQLTDLREHVSIRGAGLMWIAGDTATPARWWDTPLADLLPFNRAAGDPAPFTDPVVMTPTPLAQSLNILRLDDTSPTGWPPDLVDPDVGWSMLRWAQHIEPSAIKPTAEALAMFVPVAGGEEPGPAVLMMRYGAGRSVYVATDETWRWRYGRGEALPERFWIQMIRLLGREGLARSGATAILDVSPRRSLVDQPVRLTVELLDQSLIDTGMSSITLRLTRKPEPGEAPGDPVEVSLRRESPDSRSYSTTWTPPQAGRWAVEPGDAHGGALALRDEIVVSLPDDELRRPETNHPLLASLAQQTGGRVLNAADLPNIAADLPNRRTRLVHETPEPLWDTPLALLSVVLLLTLEWIGRRLIRLI